MVKEHCWRGALERHFPKAARRLKREVYAENAAEWKAAYKLCTLMPWPADFGYKQYRPMHACVPATRMEWSRY